MKFKYYLSKIVLKIHILFIFNIFTLEYHIHYIVKYKYTFSFFINFNVLR